MAREILFRAKRIDNGEWVYGNYAFTDTFGGKHWIFQNKAFDKEVEKNTICQYTGLTDKNGNKIWENDILEWEYNNVPSDYYECVWLEDECAFAFRHFRYKEHYENPVDCHDECYTGCFSMKVISNIFDNPELLDR